ncbi:MAG: hypothetical protein SA339_13180 [Methanomassiliicoccus sp.]|nr:hypothetical protein [Methanomassiliicoccus sp.]
MSEYKTIEDTIDAPYVNRVILLVADKGSARLGDFTTITKSTRTINDVVSALEKFGIFSIDVISKPRRTVNISLTKKGKKVAMHLRKAIDSFNEISDGDDS